MPCVWGQNGVEPQQQGEPGAGREKLDWVVSQGAEAFESGHTCLSCERPYSPWLADIPEQRQRETEAERAECERPRGKRKLKCKVDRGEANKWQRKLSTRKEKGLETVFCAASPL